MKLAHAFSHSPNTDTDPLGLNLRESFLRHSLAVILNLDKKLVVAVSNTDLSRFASRMAMDVCQGFLHQPKYGEFYLRGKPL